MKKFQYTCRYLADEEGHRVESADKTVQVCFLKNYVYCSTIDILMVLINRWNRQGNKIYTYYIDIDDSMYNQLSRSVNYTFADSPSLGEIAWNGMEQHSFEYIRVKD